MWNNISTYVGTRSVVNGLNSTYYALIGNRDNNMNERQPISPPPEVEPTPDFLEDTDDEEASGHEEVLLRLNRHKRSRAPEVGNSNVGGSNPGTSMESRAVSSGSLPRQRRPLNSSNKSPGEKATPRRLTASRTLLRAGLNLLADAHSFPRAKLPYVPPPNGEVGSTESGTPTVVGRGESSSYSALATRMYPDILNIPTRSDYEAFTGQLSSLHIPVSKRRPSAAAATNDRQSEESCSSQSVFDVEEDSKFEFYVEDLDSSGDVQPREVSVRRISAVGPSITKSVSQLVANQRSSGTAPSTSRLATPESSTVFYANPRYGDRYACKNPDIISTVTQRNYSAKTSPRKIGPKRCSTTDKFLKEVHERRATLKPIRRCNSVSLKDKDQVSSKEGQNPNRSLQSGTRAYKDSTQFLFPPVLSESGLSVGMKRKAEGSDEYCSSDEEVEVPSPDMEAIREYNRQLEQAMETASVSSVENSSVYLRGVPGPVGSSMFTLPESSATNLEGESVRVKAAPRSSLVTNIPCDSWMMLPLRVLPGEMVPWGLLIFVPLILFLLGAVGYVVVCLATTVY